MPLYFSGDLVVQIAQITNLIDPFPLSIASKTRCVGSQNVAFKTKIYSLSAPALHHYQIFVHLWFNSFREQHFPAIYLFWVHLPKKNSWMLGCAETVQHGGSVKECEK